MAFIASFSIYAQEVNTVNAGYVTTSNEESIELRVGERVFLTGIVIDMRYITYPYRVVFGIPFEGGDVLGVSGPADANINWSIDAYNVMTIDLYEDDLVGLIPDDIRYIEITTRNINY